MDFIIKARFEKQLHPNLHRAVTAETQSMWAGREGQLGRMQRNELIGGCNHATSGPERRRSMAEDYWSKANR